jgi:hypothetical protein
MTEPRENWPASGSSEHAADLSQATLGLVASREIRTASRKSTSIGCSIKSKADFASGDFESAQNRRQSSRVSIRARSRAMQDERQGPGSPEFLN